MKWVQLNRPAPWPQAASPRRGGTRGGVAALTLLMSPLKTTSSAFSCSTFRASSSWQASASWASYGSGESRREPHCLRAAGRARWDEAGQGGPHLLELVHALLQLQPHHVLLFPPADSEGPAPGCGVLPPPLSAPRPSGSGPGPGSASPDGRSRAETCGSRLPASSQLTSCLPGTSGLAPFKSNCGCSGPSQGPARPAVRLASSPSFCPHHPARSPTSSPQIRAPACCLHQNRARLARCPASCGTINPVKAAAGHIWHQQRWSRAC